MQAPFPQIETFDNRPFEDLAAMFVAEDILCELPQGALLQTNELNYSIESLSLVDEYLDAVHRGPKDDDQGLTRVVFRGGSYVGEVVRRLSPVSWNWISYEEASHYLDAVTQGQGPHPATAAVLATESGQVRLPFGKVFKYILNGSEDSTRFFVESFLAHDRRDLQ